MTLTLQNWPAPTYQMLSSLGSTVIQLFKPFVSHFIYFHDLPLSVVFINLPASSIARPKSWSCREKSIHTGFLDSPSSSHFLIVVQEIALSLVQYAFPISGFIIMVFG